MAELSSPSGEHPGLIVLTSEFCGAGSFTFDDSPSFICAEQGVEGPIYPLPWQEWLRFLSPAQSCLEADFVVPDIVVETKLQDFDAQPGHGLVIDLRLPE